MGLLSASRAETVLTIRILALDLPPDFHVLISRRYISEPRCAARTAFPVVFLTETAESEPLVSRKCFGWNIRLQLMWGNGSQTANGRTNERPRIYLRLTNFGGAVVAEAVETEPVSYRLAGEGDHFLEGNVLGLLIVKGTHNDHWIAVPSRGISRTHTYAAAATAPAPSAPPRGRAGSAPPPDGTAQLVACHLLPAAAPAVDCSHPLRHRHRRDQ